MAERKRGDRRDGARRSRIVVLALALIAATWAGAANAVCASRIDPGYLDSITAEPRSLLRQHPRGGDPLAFKIRTLAVHGTRILKALGTVVPQANSQQKEAIGQGLARAEGACSARSPEIARQITELVRASGDRDVTRVYIRFFSTTEDTNKLPNSTSTFEQGQDAGRRGFDMKSDIRPRPLPLGDPFAKP